MSSNGKNGHNDGRINVEDLERDICLMNRRRDREIVEETGTAGDRLLQAMSRLEGLTPSDPEYARLDLERQRCLTAAHEAQERLREHTIRRPLPPRRSTDTS